MNATFVPENKSVIVSNLFEIIDFLFSKFFSIATTRLDMSVISTQQKKNYFDHKSYTFTIVILEKITFGTVQFHQDNTD